MSAPDMITLETHLREAVRAIQIAERLALDEDPSDELITFAILAAGRETRAAIEAFHGKPVAVERAAA